MPMTWVEILVCRCAISFNHHNRMYMNIHISHFVALATLFAFTACNPQVPSDEVKEKNHQDTHSLEITFTPGAVKDDRFTPDPSGKVLKLKAGEDTNWVPSGILNAEPNTPYYVEVKHYSAKGDLINGELATNGEDRIHQHFFMPVRLPSGTKPKEIISYQYLDTDPWNAPMISDAKVIGSKNPLGLKGVMTFNRPDTHFGIRLRLMHARGSKWNSKGELSPFYQPGIWTANAQYDVDFTFDVHIQNK